MRPVDPALTYPQPAEPEPEAEPELPDPVYTRETRRRTLMPVYGIPECLAKLAAVGIVANAGAEVAVRDVSEEVKAAAQGLVPVDTGELQNSIQVTEEGVEAGTDHAIYVEFGTYRMSAQPFMRPAADEASGEEALRKLAAVIQALG